MREQAPQKPIYHSSDEESESPRSCSLAPAGAFLGLLLQLVSEREHLFAVRNAPGGGHPLDFLGGGSSANSPFHAVCVTAAESEGELVFFDW